MQRQLAVHAQAGTRKGNASGALLRQTHQSSPTQAFICYSEQGTGVKYLTHEESRLINYNSKTESGKFGAAEHVAVILFAIFLKNKNTNNSA